MSKITGIVERLTDESRRLGGAERAYLLFREARIVVCASETTTKYTVGRKAKPLGEAEIVTFHRDGNVPTHARRVPATGQQQKNRDGDVWYVVCWIWNKDNNNE